MSDMPLALVVLVKTLAHWATTGLPLVIAAPLLGIMLNVPAEGLAVVTLTLLVGTPAITMVGAIGAALTVGLRRGGLLLPVLILPLTVPVLIFGISATQAALVGPVPVATPLAVLAGLTLAAIALAPWAAAAALRLALE